MELFIKILLIVLFVVIIGCVVFICIETKQFLQEMEKFDAEEREILESVERELENIKYQREVIERNLGVEWDEKNKVYWWRR